MVWFGLVSIQSPESHKLSLLGLGTREVIVFTINVTQAMNQYFLYKNYKKNLKFKNISSFCKAILKSIGSVCYTWTKSYIYNINNNIKLSWPKFKWV